MPEVVQFHVDQGKNVGLIPASIGTSALDVDQGDPADLFDHHPARVVLPSRRRNGRHGYYDDGQRRGNEKWAAYGCAGEVRSAKGFLVLYDNAIERLAAALDVPGRFPFPADLFEAAGMELPVLYAPIEQGPAIVAGRPKVLPMLETIREPGRNNALFDVVRWWTYAQDRGQSMQAWYERVTAYTLHNNERFPVPLERWEGCKVAYNVATWTWCGGGPADHSPAAQSRRGVKSGQVRRAATRKRDAAIVADRAAGMSYGQLAAKYELTKRAVHYIVHRDAPLLEG